MKLQKEQV